MSESFSWMDPPKWRVTTIKNNDGIDSSINFLATTLLGHTLVEFLF